jgi:uncharacterized RDD family membrane protein YckC
MMGLPAASIPVEDNAAAAPRKPAAANKRERTLITSEGIAVPVVVASRTSRFGALVLDFVMLYIGLIVFVMVLLWIAGGLLQSLVDGANSQAAGAGEFLIIVFVLGLFLARYGYFLAFELGPRGATLGKRAVGIRIAARDGGRLTPEAVIARNLLRDIELFMPLAFLSVAPTGQAGSFGFAGLVWLGAILAIPLLNKDCLRAGDIIAGTWVLEAPRTKLADALSTQGAAAAAGSSEVTGARYQFGEDELSVYGEHELQTLERVLREGQSDAIEAVHATICRKIGWDPGAGDERAFLEAFYAQLRAKLETDMRFGKRKADKHS